MTDTDSSTEETQTEAVTTEETTDPYQELLQQITNDEGKPKYRSVEDALNGAQHAQGHIKTLEEENAQLKQEQERMEELLTQLQSKTDQAPTTESTATTDTTESPKPDERTSDTEQLDEEALLEKVEARLSAKREQEQKEQNKRQALEAVQERYADKAADFVQEKASELGVTTEFLLDMAATSPKAFYNATGITAKKQQSSNWQSSSVNTSSMEQPKQEFNGGNPMLTGRTKDAVGLWNSLGN